MNFRISLLILCAFGTAACSGAEQDGDFFGPQSGAEQTATLGQPLTSNRADLAVTASGPATATTGDNASYSVSVSNVGGRKAASSGLNVDLPPGVTVTAMSSGCSELSSPHRISCSLGTLQPGVTKTKSFSVDLPSAAGVVSFDADAWTSSREDVMGNNSDSVNTNVSATVYAPVLNLPQTLNASDCFGVSSYDQCVPQAMLYATLVLESGGNVDTGVPYATGTWSQPGGASTLEMVFKDGNGDWISTFTGTGVSASCFEGTITGAYAYGAFRACTN